MNLFYDASDLKYSNTLRDHRFHWLRELGAQAQQCRKTSRASNLALLIWLRSQPAVSLSHQRNGFRHCLTWTAGLAARTTIRTAFGRRHARFAGHDMMAAGACQWSGRAPHLCYNARRGQYREVRDQKGTALMSQPPHLAADPLNRFRDLYDALNAERGWFGDPSSLRFAAMTAVTCQGSPAEVTSAIRSMAEEIKRLSGWFGELNSSLRFIVSAILVLNRDSASDFLAEVERGRELFRQASLRRGGIYETIAILILRLQNDLAPITTEAVIRFKAIYEEMKRHHWWLTGPDDFPACAILVGQEASPGEIGAAIERIYQALNETGFSTGDPLQTAANLLYLSRLDPDVAAERYFELANGFRQSGVAIWQSDYDELAILTFLNHPPYRVVERVLEHRKAMEELKPKPDRSLTFNLAASIAFLELVQLDENLGAITDAKALMDMQSIINAQQAAAAAAASSAATAAAASSSS